MTPPGVPARHYRGTPADERRAQRRAQLMAAAMRVYGERGYRQSTVKAVCEAAGLTERYFYESFVNSEALLLACYEAVTRALYAKLAQVARDTGGGHVARVRAMLRAYLLALQREPHAARVFLLEIRGISPEIDALFEAALQEFGEGLARAMAPRSTEHDAMLQAGVVAGVMHMALRWIASGYQPALDQVAEAALQLCRALRS